MFRYKERQRSQVEALDNAAQSFETDHSDGGASDREDVRSTSIFCPTGSGDPDDAGES